MRICFYFEGCGDHRDVHVRTHSFPTRRSSDLTDAPRLIDLRWGDPSHPKVTLVGKGVCFDTGGYDIKPSGGMLTMKKDMGGSAQVLGLARMIMRSEEHTSELQSLMRISYAVFCLKKKNHIYHHTTTPPLNTNTSI